MRAQSGKVGVVVALLVLGGAGAALMLDVTGGAGAGPTVAQPTGRVAVVEGSTGTTAAVMPVTLEPAASSTVTVDFETLDNTATAASNDFEPVTGTLTFAPGETSKAIEVPVNGDTALEDYELFRVRLENVAGATLGSHVRKVEIRNDETPALVVSPVRATEGKVVPFKTRLSKRFYRPVVVDVVTRDGTARAPADYAPKATAVAVAAGTRGPVVVNVATKRDAVSEPEETVHLHAYSAGMLAAAVATVVNAPPPASTAPASSAACNPGSIPTSPQPRAPASPSSRGMFLPPDSVRDGDPWVMVWNDEFQDPAYTAAKWDTGMRTGDKTLESNGELQWYQPGNSVLTTDNDGFDPLGVLRQTVKREAVPGTAYSVRTLSRLYPPARCPSYYDPNANNSTSASNKAETRTPYQFTSGMLNNSKSFGFKYGYIETRVKMPKGFALWPALWLRDWGGWGYEIDVFEIFDRQSRTFRTAYWWGSGNDHSTENDGGDIGITADGDECRQHLPVPASSDTAAECSLATAVDLSAGYHTIGLWWTDDKYELYFDGVKRWTSPAGADVADTYQHLIMNLAFGNNEYEFDWTKRNVRPFHPSLFDSSLFPKRTVEWDYVRIWQPAAATDVCTPPACG